jgi:glycosyltransferase involved in cell wall biosynthesis
MLQTLCKELSLTSVVISESDLESPPAVKFHVYFLLSIGEGTKDILYSQSTALVYTPSFEHFGITPIEGMSFGVPVIAVGNGGPKESVEHLKTGYLCSSRTLNQMASSNDGYQEEPVNIRKVLETIARHSFSYNINSTLQNEEDEALSNSFAAGMKWVLEIPDRQRKQISENAKSRANLLFSNSCSINSLQSVIQELVEDDRKSK